ncbi:MAG TPA: cytochrome P450 [Solirubrobacterales bacterium]|nr:cytochrome P450 [Solirubrobacterales bacterium]
MRAALPPGPRAPKIVQTVGWWKRTGPYMERCRRRYGKRFTIELVGMPPFVMLSDPADVKEVFTAPPEVLHPGEGARVLEPIVGRHSVILLDEGRHLEQRKLMLPAFHGERMAKLADVVEEVAEHEVAAWPADGAISLHPRLQALTLDVILRAVFGLEEGERLDALRSRLTGVLEFSVSPLSLMLDMHERLHGRGPFAEVDRQKREADELIEGLVAERRREGDDRGDVLSMLLEARHEDGTPMSVEELRDELMTLLVAGHETTASALAWAFERLSRNPAALGRLVEEIDDGGEEYLMAVIHETLRRRPVLPNAAPRLVMEEVEIGGWRYPVGACLNAHAYLVHHDPEIYPDPYAFRPERFLGTKPGTYTWIPFGGGRRRCLGAGFALLEMKAVLRRVLAARELRPAGDSFEPARRRAITVSPRRGAVVALGLRGRGGAQAAASGEPVAAAV